MIVNRQGMPIRFAFAPGSDAHIKACGKLTLGSPADSILYVDAAYTNYKLEDQLREERVQLPSARRRNARRQHPREIVYVQKYRPKRIETADSQITRRFPKTIATVTARAQTQG